MRYAVPSSGHLKRKAKPSLYTGFHTHQCNSQDHAQVAVLYILLGRQGLQNLSYCHSKTIMMLVITHANRHTDVLEADSIADVPHTFYAFQIKHLRILYALPLG